MTSITVGGLECNRNFCSILLNRIAAIGWFIMQRIIVDMISSFENDKSLLYARTHTPNTADTDGWCMHNSEEIRRKMWS